MTRPTRSDAVWSIDDLELELRRLPGVRAAGFDDLDDMLLVQLHVADSAERIDRSDRNDQPVPVSASRIAARHSDRPVAVEVVRWRSATVTPPPFVPLTAGVPAPAPAEIDISNDQPAESRVADARIGESRIESAVAAAAEVDLVVETVTVETVTVEAVEPEPVSRARLLAVLAFPDTDELEVHLVLDGKRTIGRAPVSKGIESAAVATIDAVRDLGTGVQARVRWARALDDAGEVDQVVVAVALEGVDARAPLHYGLAAGASLIDAAARATLDALNRRLTRVS